MGARSRRKGAGWERELASRWRDAGLYPNARRGLNQVRSARETCDVEGTPFWVECKCGKRPNLIAAMVQAETDTDGRPCIVVAKRDRSTPLVTMTLETFERLVGEGIAARTAAIMVARAGEPPAGAVVVDEELREAGCADAGIPRPARRKLAAGAR